MTIIGFEDHLFGNAHPVKTKTINKVRCEYRSTRKPTNQGDCIRHKRSESISNCGLQSHIGISQRNIYSANLINDPNALQTKHIQILFLIAISPPNGDIE